MSKRPHSQMSCSRALVLMAMVNRTCATRSWTEAEQTSEKAGRAFCPLWSPGTLGISGQSVEGATRAREEVLVGYGDAGVRPGAQRQ